jgi:CRISPR-associated protein Csx17
MPPIQLKGCHPDSVASYLKALGVLRLIHEQTDSYPPAKGYWQNDIFILQSEQTPESLIHFFLRKYKPTPLLAPWNGSTGFYPKDNRKTLDALEDSKTVRLQPYREAIKIAQNIVTEMGLDKQPGGNDPNKRLLIRHLRDQLPDLAVRWIDTCALVSSDNVQYPPLLGTGGNDGNFEFSRTFQQQLQNLFDFDLGEPTPASETLLRASLLGEFLPGLAFSGKIGQFDPMAAGGANAAPGFDAKSRVNPWDYVLMLEGTFAFQTRLTRKFESSAKGALTYPFAVRPTPAGYGSAAEDENIRAETWLPLWSKPARWNELQVLFGEGRAKLGGRVPKTGVDFALAITNLGKLRGLDEFVRYSFQERNGLSYFAVPLGRFSCLGKAPTNLLAELEDWLLSFRRVAESKDPPTTVKRVHRLLEKRIVELSRDEKQTGVGGNNALEVLIALGEVEKVLNRSISWIKKIEQESSFLSLSPIPWLNFRWIRACYDDSVEFRLALALAGRGLYRQVQIDPKTQNPQLINYPESDRGLRQRLVQVRQKTRPDWSEDDGITIWGNRTLVDNLIALLQREEIEAQQREKHEETTPTTPEALEIQKFKVSVTACLEDIATWIKGNVNEERLEQIARGLALIENHRPVASIQQTQVIPAAFSLIEPVFRRVVSDPMNEFKAENSKIVLPRVPSLLSHLKAGDCLAATDLAVRRLKASRFRLAIRKLYEPRERSRRIAAALAFPISEADSEQLLKQVCYDDPDLTL